MSNLHEPHPEENGPQGLSILAADEFSFAGAIGGVRGLIESVAPGLIFVVMFVITRDLRTTLIASVAVALVAVVARLIQRAPVTPALSGLFGVAIGVLWAWRSGDAEDYFALGLWTNAIYTVGLFVSVVIRWPIVGVVVEGLRSGILDVLANPESDADDPKTGKAEDPAALTAPPGRDDQQVGEEPVGEMSAFAQWSQWRHDAGLMRRYAIATWLWIGMFALRLAVQLPLYLTEMVGWLGTARLVMGIPLFAVTLWVTWLLVRRDPSEAR